MKEEFEQDKISRDYRSSEIPNTANGRPPWHLPPAPGGRLCGPTEVDTLTVIVTSTITMHPITTTHFKSFT